MKCPKCGRDMRRSTLPYLTAEAHSTNAPIDTGMVVCVDLCTACNYAIVPVGERPFFPSTGREIHPPEWKVVGTAAKAEDLN